MNGKIKVWELILGVISIFLLSAVMLKLLNKIPEA
jgi:hypothetical protein